MEFFRARYDRLSKGSTALVLVLLAGAALLVLWRPVPVAWVRYQLLLLFVLIPALTYSYSPLGYSVGPEGVRIHRLRGPVLVPLAAIRGARRAAPDELGGIRTFGSGGLFGFFGRFWSRRFGHYRAYVTHRHNLVVVEAERVYLLSPERPDDFLHRLREWLPQLSSR